MIHEIKAINITFWPGFPIHFPFYFLEMMQCCTLQIFLLLLLQTTDGAPLHLVVDCEPEATPKWTLAMNLNPSDGHIMDYTTGWAHNKFIGTYASALSKDYLNRVVWNEPASYIAIVRHQQVGYCI